jgi:DNA helicase-2/ATP-dependent DNA helicase PcrA
VPTDELVPFDDAGLPGNRDASRAPEVLRLARTLPAAGPRTRIDYASELNPQQLAAVTAGGGPVLVLAGAGSGKTRVITYRVAWLIENGVRPGNILLTTFTNRAARAMLGRVETLLGADLSSITGGTFHHVCNIMLRRHAPLLGFTENFTILDADDAVRMMKRVRAESGVDTKERMFPAPRVLSRIASLMVNTEMGLDRIIIRHYPQFSQRILDFERVFARYAAEKQRQNAMDYDDLLLWTWRLLSEHDEVRREIAERYRHVLVDEYQDTNHLQAKLVELWSSEHGNLFVVGDDAQSIYSFRGANYRNILTFPERFPGAATYKLETNYRSTQAILTLANEVLRDTPEAFKKTLRAVKPEGAKPALVVCRNPDDQADFIAGKILELREDGKQLADIGVLYRAHRNSQEIEMAMGRHGIPYFIRGGVRFMEMAHIKDLLAYLVIFGSPRNELAWERVLSMCEGIGGRTISRVLEAMSGVPDPLAELIGGRYLDLAYGAGKTSLRALSVFLGDIAKEIPNRDPAVLARTIHKRRYSAYLKENYDNAQRREDDIEQFFIYASRFASLGEMLSEVALHGGFGGEEVAAADPAAVEEGRVCLSTIHQAKGLEWKVVFLVWCVDGTLPHNMTFDDPDALDEERRLFYVAVTRAKDELVLSYPQERSRADFSVDLTMPSRYLREVSKHYDEFILEWDDPKREAKQEEARERRITGGIDIEKLGGKMLGGGDASKPGGVWMPDIPDPWEEE